jgi:hypothetical protein
MTSSVMESGIRELTGLEVEQVQGGFVHVAGAVLVVGVAIMTMTLGFLSTPYYGTGTCNTDGTYTE